MVLEPLVMRMRERFGPRSLALGVALLGVAVSGAGPMGAVASPRQDDADLLLRASQLAQTVRHQGPVAVLGEAPGAQGRLAGSNNDHSWRLEDSGGSFSVTIGDFRALRTVTVIGADLKRVQVGDSVGIAIWYLDPARGLRIVDSHRSKATVKEMQPSSSPTAPLMSAGAGYPAHCTSTTADPFISWPYGPYINGWSYVTCDSPWGIYQQALIVVVQRFSPWVQVAGGGGVQNIAPTLCLAGCTFGGEGHTPCHVGGQTAFLTEVADVVSTYGGGNYLFTDGSQASYLWCSNPY